MTQKTVKTRRLDKKATVVYISSKSFTSRLPLPEVLQLDRKPIADEYLELTSEWSAAKSDTISKNIERYCRKLYPEYSEFAAKLSSITGSSKHTVYAWVNKSRGNVKVPLAKLCMIAKELNVDVREFLKENNDEEICN